MSPTHRDDLEQRLEMLARRNPTMPADVEERLRARLAAAQSRARFARAARRRFPPLSPGSDGLTIQILLLVALIATTAWVVTTRDMPLLQGVLNNCAASPAPSADPAIAAAAARAVARSRAAIAAAESCSHPASYSSTAAGLPAGAAPVRR